MSSDAHITELRKATHGTACWCSIHFFFLQHHFVILVHMSNRTQDLPPQGGFPEIKYRRYLPKRGPSGAVLLSGLVALSAYGFYKVGEGNVEKR